MVIHGLKNMDPVVLLGRKVDPASLACVLHFFTIAACKTSIVCL